MRRLSGLLKRARAIHRLSKVSIAIGFTLMTCCYITALAALLALPHAADYFYVQGLYRGAMEAAPAFLVVGVCAGLLGDLMLRKGGDGDSSDSR